MAPAGCVRSSVARPWIAEARAIGSSLLERPIARRTPLATSAGAYLACWIDFDAKKRPPLAGQHHPSLTIAEDGKQRQPR